MDTSKPHPQRFETYTLSADGKSFTIKDCKFVFKLDAHGGWKDQFGHYYNSKGQQDFEPQDAQLTPSQGSEGPDDIEDDYNEYEPDYNDDDQQEPLQMQQIRKIQKLQKNLQLLDSYPQNKPLRVYFTNISLKLSKKALYEIISKKISGIKNIIYYQNNQKYGSGHFIMENKLFTTHLIKLQGEKIYDKQIHFDVENINDLVMDPIQQSQINPFESPDQKKQKTNYAPKFKAAPPQTKQPIKKIQPIQKPQQQKQKVTENPQKVTETPQKTAQNPQKVVEKVTENPQKVTENPQKVTENPQKVTETPQKTTQIPQKQSSSKPIQSPQLKAQLKTQLKKYTLNFTIFQAPKNFYAWIIENGFARDIDVKQVQKYTKNDEVIVTMYLTNALVQKLNGKLYNEKQVKFTPI